MRKTLLSDQDQQKLKKKLQTARRKEIAGIILFLCGVIPFTIGDFELVISTLLSFLLIIPGFVISLYYERICYALKLEIERGSPTFSLS